MENELRALEDRIGQLTALARRLRTENAELRQSMQAAQSENKTLKDKVESATLRLQHLLDRFPEEAA